MDAQASNSPEHTSSERLETVLLEGLDSGEPVKVSDQWWQRKKKALIDGARDIEARFQEDLE